MLVDIFSSFDDNNQVFMSMYILIWVFRLVTILIFSSNYWVAYPWWIGFINIF